MNSKIKTFVILVLALIIANSFVLITTTFKTINDIYERDDMSTTGKASGSVYLCVNGKPSINISNCSSIAVQEQTYTCQLNATDQRYINFTYSSRILNYTKNFSQSSEDLFVTTSAGLIDFTPNNSFVGEYYVQFNVNDGLECENTDFQYLNLIVQNVNDAPYLVKNLPNVDFYSGETTHPFFLDTHFNDPDRDPLSYSYSGNHFISISIKSTSEVIITSSECPVSEQIIFTAKDPDGAYAYSNMITVRCTETTTGSGSTTTPGTGGGGGSGGALNYDCQSEYECFDFTACNQSGEKILMCVDTKGCEEIKYLSVDCEYIEEVVCNETWNCSNWEPCLPNGTQYRNCNDLNNCGTYELIPNMVQECEYIGTCNDGIKNCHNNSCEEEVDCGGPCDSCKSIQVPYPFIEEKGFLIYIITGIIMLILSSILIYHYFHKEINAGLAKLGWTISGRKNKLILITEDEKKELLEEVNKLREKIDSSKLPDLLAEYSTSLRLYYVKVFSTKDLNIEFDKVELETALQKHKNRIWDGVRKIFLFMFNRYLEVETNFDFMTKENIILLIEELRNIILQTSKVYEEDVAREIKEFKITPAEKPINKINFMIINAYIALQFLEVGVAKKKYLEIVSYYENLPVKDQEITYKLIEGLYNNINYVNSWYKPGSYN